MNVPAEMRIRQLEINLVRLRSFSGFLGQRYVVTNIPAAQIETVEDGRSSPATQPASARSTASRRS